MYGRIRSVALGVIILLSAAACDRPGRPGAPTATITAPVASAISDTTRCVGTLTGVHNDVVAPSDAICRIIDATVLGSVTASVRSSIGMSRVDLRGSLKGEGADNVRAENTQVGGGVAIMGGRVATLNFVTVRGGDVEIGMVAGPSSAVVVEDAQVSGNVHLVQNNAQTLTLRRATARQIRVLMNRGAGTKQIASNTASELMQCSGNDLPFQGGPNTAPRIEGQCTSSGTPPPPPAPVVAIDDFQRLQLGPNWTQSAGSGRPGIVSGMDFGALIPGSISVDWAATRFPADQFSEVTIAAGKNRNLMVQVHVRRQSSTLARYGFHFNLERYPAVWEIKYDGVSKEETRILATSMTQGPAPGDVIRIEARGRTVSGYRNGQLILTATDNAPNAILVEGGTGISTRLAMGTTLTTYPAPIAAAWKGGSLR